MQNDMECPYCGASQEVNHDDGAVYSEDEAHQHQCSKCDKYFVFSTAISFNYYPAKADCLNGAEHNYKFRKCYPHAASKMVCDDCYKNCDPTQDQWIAAGFINGKPELFKI